MAVICTCHYTSPEVCSIHREHLKEVSVALGVLSFHMEDTKVAQLINTLIEAHVEAAIKKLKSELTTVFFPESQR